eukprot:CAMPEP_0173186202 /NCGR_PEP_ID=MMETSP1141-20130122/9999_1 /TAXON_ID=483371 /ORGANISM="non described non described, Strain CCMP2298" /LENGTH=81 /DNA_ID=CAMNT_0014109855 /DNA_START=712 /DNA_END=957 /DNA_ORIENTATION=+
MVGREFSRVSMRHSALVASTTRMTTLSWVGEPNAAIAPAKNTSTFDTTDAINDSVCRRGAEALWLRSKNEWLRTESSCDNE